MAEKKPEAAAPAEAPAQPPAKAGPMKTMMMLAAVLALEGVTIGVTMYLAGGPRQAQGHELISDEAAELEKIVELSVVSGKYPNLRTGRTLLYDTEVFITVRKREQDATKKLLDASKAQIGMEMASIMRRAEPGWFQEATLTTVRRQFKAVLDEKLGKDAKGEPIVQDVLITKCIAFPGF